MKYLFITALFFIGFSTFSSEIEKKIEQVKKEQVTLKVKMYKERVKLLKSDNDLQDLHKRIMKLHKELAIKLSQKKEMKALSKQAYKLDSQLDALQKEKQKKEQN